MQRGIESGAAGGVTLARETGLEIERIPWRLEGLQEGQRGLLALAAVVDRSGLAASHHTLGLDLDPDNALLGARSARDAEGLGQAQGGDGWAQLHGAQNYSDEGRPLRFV